MLTRYYNSAVVSILSLLENVVASHETALWRTSKELSNEKPQHMVL